MLRGAAMEVAITDIIPDERERIAARLRELVGRVDLIVTTGGTGVSARDVTPEAAGAVIDRHLPGFGEVMRTGSFARTPLSIISRGGAGIAGRTLIVMLPGSPRGVRECLELVMPAVRHVLKILAGESAACAAGGETA